MISALVWGGWVLYFAVAEGIALYRHRTQDTFSWQVWAIERAAPVTKTLVAGGLVWLGFHFLLG